MLLRSSSTPVLGSLVSSLSDSPSVFDNNGRQSSCSENLKRLSFSHGGQSNFHRYSCNSSPASQTFELDQESGGLRGFRRAQSDGNLQGLAEAIDVEDLHVYNPTRTRRRNSKLETIPSFSVYNSRYDEEEEEEEDDDDGEHEPEQEGFVSDFLQRSRTTDSLGAFSFDKGEISDFGAQMNMMQTINPHLKEENLSGFVGGVETAPLFLAKGLGIDLSDPGTAVAGGGDGTSFHALNSGSAGGDGSNIEEYYQRMLQENPSNPLILRNYAQFLYQTKGDYPRADEYYSRAILVEPGDGEILSQYAKLIWEFYHDRERASSYFEQAVQAAPEDSHVLAAYASFLWETEGDEEDDEEEESEGLGSKDLIGIPVFHGALASAHA